MVPGELPTLDSVFAPVHSQTAFEETLERLGTAIKLGLLPAGARLPAERELCTRLGISRSTLRQALTALGQSGHLHAVRGRGGGTFVADRPPVGAPPDPEVLAGWQEACDMRVAIELGVVALATRRATEQDLAALDELVTLLDDRLDAYPLYRQADSRFHIGLAEATRSARLVAAATEVQSSMSDLISHIAHPPEVLAHANAQHAMLVGALRERDGERAVRIIAEHMRGTELVLAGLLPGPGGVP